MAILPGAGVKTVAFDEPSCAHLQIFIPAGTIFGEGCLESLLPSLAGEWFEFVWL